ncbi:MAG: HDOD domain-containing protein [Opitutaceae bacterium]|nr:HDOD domain-containing protein [Opitutaceae bacterium]
MSNPHPSTPAAGPYPEGEIRRRVDACPKLASLRSINRALADLIRSEQSYSSQIAEIIRRDPSLTARLLRMVNSVYFGLSAKVNSIEEAVFYVGLRQIRELSMATPVIEELEKIHPSSVRLPWHEMWKHSIGTAIMTRELLSNTNVYVDDDTDYIIGLLHDIGKVVMAQAFPEEFGRLITLPVSNVAAVCERERELIGWDHAQIGGYYLERHKLAPEITHAVLFHNAPEKASLHGFFAAAVQVADILVRYAGIREGFEAIDPVREDAWMSLPGWKILFGTGKRETQLARAAVSSSLERLPDLLKGLV